MTDIPVELRSRLELLVALDEALLEPELHIAGEQALYGVHNHPGADFHKSVVQVSRSVVLPYVNLFAHHYVSGIDSVVDEEGGHTADILAVDHGPVDRSGAPVLRQQGCVEVESAQARYFPHFTRQQPEGNHHKEVRFQGLHRLYELRVPELFRLIDRYPAGHGILLHCALVHLQTAPARLVRDRDHGLYLVALLQNGLQRSHRELRRTHIHYARLAEEADNFHFKFSEPGFH